MNNKWEFEIAKRIINPSSEVLEIGSANGAFLQHLKALGTKCMGLELNEYAVVLGKQKGVKILNQSIEEHAKVNSEKYDVVCSFQVLEHIAMVKEVILSSLKVLKKDGLLIISVPNNASFIKHDNGGVLNLPPHHMGLWDIESLSSLQSIFSIKIKETFYEPLQPYHYSWYYHNKMLPIVNKVNTLGKVLRKILKPFALVLLNFFGKYLRGHSILVVYKKI